MANCIPPNPFRNDELDFAQKVTMDIIIQKVIDLHNQPLKTPVSLSEAQKVNVGIQNRHVHTFVRSSILHHTPELGLDEINQSFGQSPGPYEGL
jgi:hypothetical protein